MITEGHQQFRWDYRKGQPVEQLFRRMGNPTRSVSVQKPLAELAKTVVLIDAAWGGLGGVCRERNKRQPSQRA
jgi:hypothetical protein